jgi:rhodanese-related sulfurtransferase
MTTDGIPSVDVTEASSRTGTGASDGPLIVDVREPDEVAQVRVAGATLVPMSGFTEQAAELPKDRPLLILCASGARSAAVTGYLLRSGWSDVANIDGGIKAWERAGLPVERGSAPGG